MDRTIKILKGIFYSHIAVALLLALLFETDVFECGNFTEDANARFVTLSLMELATIGLIPSALYLFKIKKIHNDLVELQPEALLKWGVIRLDMLGLPLVLNTLLYYMTMSPAYGYMAIVLLLCLLFVYPGKTRCEAEISDM
ncbi:MAG: hypothetical protein PUH24_02330 [Prevotellaceae bacterium]|nr:hypothetical protein [Prevotella sp.]MDD7257112.1 hypothetical protein [Prevotellaceae bacterium]MDY6130481.1 hypothetical protein [Prevotella sp.]